MPFRKKPMRPRRRRRQPTARTARKVVARVNRRKRIMGIPRVDSFTRSLPDQLILNTASPPLGWQAVDDGLVVPFVFSLSTLPDHTDFTNLYNGYRIMGVRMEGYFSNTEGLNYNQQTMLYYAQNTQGNASASDLTEQWFLDRPVSKKRLLMNNSRSGKAFDIYQKVYQLSNTYAGVANNDYGVVRPKFISTGETGTPHYGMCLRLQRVDGNNWTTGTSYQYPQLKIIFTYYFQCRGIS